MQSPDFLYRVENGGMPTTAGKLISLTSYEIASRLSFLLLDSMPDQKLLDLAAQDKLKDPSVAATEAERLLTSPLARGKLKDFYDFWLELKKPKALPSGPSAFVAGLDSTGFLDEAVRETREFLERTTFDKRGSFVEIMTSKDSYARTPAMASVYGHSPITGNSPATMQSGRSGLFLRTPFLVSFGSSTHPILRGVFVRQRVLCQSVGMPVDGNAFIGPDVETEQMRLRYSTRERTDLKNGPGTSCYACHKNINPAGFAFEAFDNFGRLRSAEVQYKSDGTELAKHSVDTRVNFIVDPLQPSRIQALSGGESFNEFVAADGIGGACFAKYAYEYFYQRLEEKIDGCQLQKMHAVLQSKDGSVVDAIKALVINDYLGLKKVEN